MHFIHRYKKIILSLLAISIVIIIIITVTEEEKQKELAFTDSTDTIIPSDEKLDSKFINEQIDDKIIVDVKGAIKKPGIYEMHSTDRIKQAIDKADGFTSEASIESVNLAQRVQDEMVVYVEKEGENYENQSSIADSKQTEQATSSTNSNPKININIATEEELTSLSGIGPSKADAIIKHREENGSFQSEESITDVAGIGEKTFENIQDQITIH